MNNNADIDHIIDGIDNLAVLEALIKSKSVIGRHQKIIVSISGGSDSDIVLDIVEKTKGNRTVEYIWFDTGLEYQATKNHLKYLEQKYGIKIQARRAIKPIPICCREYGAPFLSKQVSEFISRLQKYNFKFEDKSFDELYAEYPKCKSALQWWCNCKNGDKKSMFNINHNRWLKEFLIANPPQFKISNKCCTYAKKKVSQRFLDETDADLSIIGIRKSEGGVRTTAYKNCFTSNNDGIDQYRPIFWMNDTDKKYYEERFGITHSDCYTKYGLKRTGCVGCPYGQNLNDELDAVYKFEPKLYLAINNIFKDSYEYTKQYKEFCAMMNNKNNINEP
ncbi:MAG: phosphoadenosine phosphosulfate reductase family protein [Bacteroidaceae bacterium]|nr:phosphoadenosine phosphosulfate reductase family protein [Bacteroidaceae bacterium]